MVDPVQVTNRDSGKKYRVVTTDFPPLKFWRTTVWAVGFLGFSKITPVLILASPSEEIAGETHAAVRSVVEQLPPSAWQMPEPMIDFVLQGANLPNEVQQYVWEQEMEKMRQHLFSLLRNETEG